MILSGIKPILYLLIRNATNVGLPCYRKDETKRSRCHKDISPTHTVEDTKPQDSVEFTESRRLLEPPV